MADGSEPDLRGQLKFENDKGAGRSKWIAVFLALLLIVWMGSGYLMPTEVSDEVAEEVPSRIIAVSVMQSTAQDIELVLTAEGQSLPDRATGVQAEVSGQVVSVAVGRGDLVSSGQEIGRINPETFEAQLLRAQTELEQAERDYDNAVALQARGVATEDRVAMSRANKAAAEAYLTEMQEELDSSIIRAPFAGRLNDLTLDEGEFVNSGEIVAEVVDNDPLVVVVQVPQQALSRLEKGQLAEVSFITGETKDGVLSFLGSNADAQTRTFRAEITVDNPDSVMPAGLSARIAIPTGQTRGHFISPAILSLGPSGELGVKTVVNGDTVAFTPVSIVRAQTDGIWVTGLDETAQIITIGQGFVRAGDRVNPQVAAAIETSVVTQ